MTRITCPAMVMGPDGINRPAQVEVEINPAMAKAILLESTAPQRNLAQRLEVWSFEQIHCQ